MELLLPFRCRCGEVVADRDREKLDTDSESTIVVALEWRWGRDRAATCRRAMCNFKCQKQQKRRTGKEKSEPEWRLRVGFVKVARQLTELFFWAGPRQPRHLIWARLQSTMYSLSRCRQLF